MEKSIVQTLREQVIRLKEEDKDYTQLQYLLNNLQGRYSSLLEEKTRAEEDCALRLEAANRNLQSLKQDYGLLKEELEEQVAKNDQLRAEARKEKDYFHEAELSQERHRRECDRLVQANARLREDNQDLEQQLRKLKEERRNLFDRIDHSTRTIEDYQEASKSKDSQLTQLERDKRLLQKENKQLKLDLDGLRQKLRQAELSLKESEHACSNTLAKQLAIENAFNKVTGRAQELERELAEAREEVEQLAGRIRETERQIGELQQCSSRQCEQSQKVLKQLQTDKRELVKELTKKHEEQLGNLVGGLEAIQLLSQEGLQIQEEVATLVRNRKTLRNAHGKVSRDVKRSLDYLNQVLSGL